MARKEKKYHFIYKTTNLLSGKYYIGMHSTNNLEDGYLGSGNRIRRSIKKYGKENFSREILEFVDTRQLLVEREEEIVNLEEIAKEECMNLKVGGTGGFRDEKHRENFYKAHGGWIHIDRMKNDKEYREKTLKTLSDNRKKAIENGNNNIASFEGHTHSEETKKKMSEVAKRRNPEQNSQYGSCWITNEIESKKIKKDDTIPEGWRLGRKMK